MEDRLTMNILVVDDDEECRNLLRELLGGDPEVQLEFANDGAHAWWILSDPRKIFDAGIFDIKMPVVDGLSLVERMRYTPQFKKFPVMLCTGTQDRETVARAAHLAISQYILKPFNPKVVRDKIQALKSSQLGVRRILAGS